MMSQNHSRIRNMRADKQAGLSGQASGGNGHGPFYGSLSWYFARPPLSELTYVLTTTGYIILPAEIQRTRRR